LYTLLLYTFLLVADDYNIIPAEKWKVTFKPREMCVHYDFRNGLTKRYVTFFLSVVEMLYGKR